MKTNQCMCCNLISHALHHACTYPGATQKGVADLCLCQLQYLLKCMCILPVLTFSHYVATDMYN